MNQKTECKETFLDGVVSVSLYATSASTFSIPFSVPQITGIKSTQLPGASLTVAISGEDAYLADTITAKNTITYGENGLVYAIEINATLPNNSDELRKGYANMAQQDHYAILKTAGGTRYLAYTAPGTYNCTIPTNITTTDETRTLNVSMKSKSDFIPITEDTNTEG